MFGSPFEVIGTIILPLKPNFLACCIDLLVGLYILKQLLSLKKIHYFDDNRKEKLAFQSPISNLVCSFSSSGIK